MEEIIWQRDNRAFETLLEIGLQEPGLKTTQIHIHNNRYFYI
jgi:hypothetical protein